MHLPPLQLSPTRSYTSMDLLHYPAPAPDMAITKNPEELVNDCPIEEVRLTVPIVDDPTLPVLTFRTWFLGLIICVALAFINQFVGYRQDALHISSVSVQIIVLPVGRFMAATLPTKAVKLPVLGWSFSLNPGPFSLKEHALISIFANSGTGSVYAVNIITIIKAFYHRKLHPVAALLLSHVSQLLGYGWAGLFRRYLVDSPYMWWPAALVNVSFFRAMHDGDRRPRGGTTRLQFFFIVMGCSFAYFIVPSYLFPSISALSFVCWIWKDSITAQQIGSGLHGLGLGSFGFDWATASSFTGSPMAYPAFSIFNILFGFFVIVYVMTPLFYWTNAYEAKRFPIFSSDVFDSQGNSYNVTRVLDQKDFQLDLGAYESYSKIYLSVFFALFYGLNFATVASTVSHVFLFNGKSIWQIWRKISTSTKEQFDDIHVRTMKKNYKAVPQWWFHVVLVVVLILSLLTCEGFGKQLQLPYWGMILACGIALFFTLPIGIITATTNQQPGLNVITELIIGYIYPYEPLANVAFKTCGYISMSQAISFIADFKFGHYMKIPPRSMFIVQLMGTLVSTTVYFGTAWWLLETIHNICDADHLPDGSPWTCPGDDVFYNASVIWGLVGPLRTFGRLGVYPGMNWFFLAGFLLPVLVWLMTKAFPNQKWIKLVHVPIILCATCNMPPARAVNFIVWGVTGIFFNYYIYNRYKGWWVRHNYVLSAGLDAGFAFIAVLLYFSLKSYNINGIDWWGFSGGDHCPLAQCPTAPGIVVDGCPVIQ